MNRLSEMVDLQRLTTGFVEFLPKLGAAIVVLFLFHMIFRAIRRPLKGILERAGFHAKLIQLMVDSILRYTLLVFGLVMAVDQLGVNVGAALAGIGVAGIAVGFAAQDSVANVISGVLIFWDKPFIVGDWIEVEGQFGKVSDITLRTTRIRTPRNTYIVLPNKAIIDAVLENHSKHGEVRIDVPVGIAYKEDILKAREVLLDAVRDMQKLSTRRAHDVVVTELGDSSINLNVRVWVDSADDETRTRTDVLEASKLALDAAGIEIPFPHLQLFVDNVEDRVWKGAARLRSASS